MTAMRWIAVVLLGMQLAGCAWLDAVDGDLDRKLDGWVAQREYGRALAVLDYVGPEHPRYPELMERRRVIRAAAEAHAAEVVGKAAALAEQGAHSEAHAHYRKALQLAPDDAELRAAYETFRTNQAARIDGLNRELLVTRAEWLMKALPLHCSLVEADPDDRTESQRLHELEAESRRLVARLITEGRAALERQDIKTASLLLPLAARLDPASEVASLEELRAAQTKENRQARAAQARAIARKRRNEVGALKAAFEEARAESRLREAHEIALRLVELDAADTETMQLAEEIDHMIRDAVQARLDEGISLYSRGRFEEALAAWRVAGDLEPENEQIRGNIRRAERVIGRLEELRRKQSAAEPASATP